MLSEYEFLMIVDLKTDDAILIIAERIRAAVEQPVNCLTILEVLTGNWLI